MPGINALIPIPLVEVPHGTGGQLHNLGDAVPQGQALVLCVKFHMPVLSDQTLFHGRDFGDCAA